ncbi:ABC transporter substrate-binding protein [Paracoccus siganidrum]|uniref:Leucine-binding protein domain-containing protein n=1 Tax=Paracoccus siganidrum TaxID=1276757 RepID=A0A419AAW5_9RHOB|nr:ABC transporter substrate-binding protein [Paracoccus siganidrum]RJL20264.1 hypothetical protein D3P05_03710 [Paracoccus siganidrum]RMC30724.1 hypothetical protein C9E82_17135 [Paracoccus siganidrum]
MTTCLTGLTQFGAVAGVIAGALATPVAAGDIKVAIIHSLTGAPAFIGVPYVDGLTLGIDQINEQKALGPNTRIVYSRDDDAGDRGQAMGLLTRHAADSGVRLILGTTTGAISPATAAAAVDLEVPFLSLSGADAVSQAAPWAFPMTQPPRVTVPEMARFAGEELSLEKCTIFSVMESEAYIAMAKFFEESARGYGIEIAGYETIKQTDFDFSALAVKVAQSDVDCVFISTPAPAGANLVMQLRQAGLDPEVKILGHTALSSPDFLTVGEGAVEGVYLLSEFPPGGTDESGRAFAEAYKARYGKEADNWAAIGYATSQVLAAALSAAGEDPSREAVRDAIAGVKDVPVIVGSGRFNFTEDRFVTTGMNILQVRDGAFASAVSGDAE